MPRTGRCMALVAVVLVASVAVGSKPASAAPSEALACWKFNGDLTDATANGRDLQFHGAPSFAPGVEGQALVIDESEWAERPGDDQAFDFGGDDFTVSAWFNLTDSLRGQQMIVNKWGAGGGGWYLRYQAEDTLLFTNGFSFAFFASGDVSDNTWHRVVVRRTGPDFTMHLDGVLIGSHAQSVVFTDHASPLRIGQRSTAATDSQLVGRVDAVSLWDGPVSDAALAASCSAPLPTVEITSAPTSPTDDATATIEFVASAPTTCQVDAGPPVACASPFTTSPLTDGDHTVTVVASNAAGTSSDSTTFTVNVQPPDTAITSGPTGTIYDGSATFEFTATEPNATFECRLDGGPWTPCSSPHTQSGYSAGAHTFEVRAIDQHGAVDQTPAARSFTYQACALVQITLRLFAGMPIVICL